MPIRTPRSNGAARGGFTLLELLVVMTIIAIMFFAVRPNFVHALQADRERSVMREVSALLSFARTEAVARGRLVRVAVSTQPTELWAEAQAQPDLRTAGAGAQDYRTQFDRLSLMGRARLRLPDYVRLSECSVEGLEAKGKDGQMIYFYPDGRTSGAMLTFTGARGQEYTIELSSTTGKVEIRV